jgi:hypothetical protein
LAAVSAARIRTSIRVACSQIRRFVFHRVATTANRFSVVLRGREGTSAHGWQHCRSGGTTSFWCRSAAVRSNVAMTVVGCCAPGLYRLLGAGLQAVSALAALSFILCDCPDAAPLGNMSSRSWTNVPPGSSWNVLSSGGTEAPECIKMSLGAEKMATTCALTAAFSRTSRQFLAYWTLKRQLVDT